MSISHAALLSNEIAAVADICAAATPAEREALGLYCERHGHALVLACSADPGILWNRSIGLGPGDEGRIDEIIEVFRRHKARRAFVSISDEHGIQLAPLLEAHGLVQARGWMKFTRRTAPIEKPRSILVVRKVDNSNGADFARIACNAFDMPEGFQPILARLPEREHWHVFMTFDGHEPAGCGALYVHNGIAWVGFGATDPAHRKLGSQSLVMAARVQQAIDLGAEFMHTETGEAVVGDPQHSYHNIERAGFRPEHRIFNFALES